MPARDRTRPLTQKQAAAFLEQIDPGASRAELAVAAQEGWGGGIGDQGTSFGPFQLHQGGAYPSSAPQSPSAANRWAWSRPGLRYADSRIRAAVPGLETMPADRQVAQIVRRFERPANPNAEVAAALRSLGGVTASSGRGARPAAQAGVGGLLGALSGVPGLNLITGPAAAVSSVADFLKAAAWLLNPINWLRAVEAVFGFVLLLLGLYFMAQAGKAAKAAGRIGRVPGVRPASRAVAGAADLGRRGVARRRRRELDEGDAHYREHRRMLDEERLEKAQKRMRVREQKQMAKRRRLARSSQNRGPGLHGIPF